MKLKLSHRLLLYIGAVVVLSLGAVTILISVLNNQIILTEEGKSFFSLPRLGFVLGGVVLLAFGFFCLSLPHRMKQAKSGFVVQKTASGEMRVSVQAIESIVQKGLSDYEEIKLQQLQAQHARGGIEVELRASIAGNVNLPLAVNAIQRHIRQLLQSTVGIDAREIRVIIDKTDQAAANSPYRIQPAELKLPDEQPGDRQDLAKDNHQAKEGTHGQV